jgi:hypothetical protein
MLQLFLAHAMIAFERDRDRDSVPSDMVAQALPVQACLRHLNLEISSPPNRRLARAEARPHWRQTGLPERRTRPLLQAMSSMSSRPQAATKTPAPRSASWSK